MNLQHTVEVRENECLRWIEATRNDVLGIFMRVFIGILGGDVAGQNLLVRDLND
jgi:hypothetical protein